MSAKKKKPKQNPHRAFTNASRQGSHLGPTHFEDPSEKKNKKKNNFDPDQPKSVDKDVKLNIQMVTK